MAADLVVDLLLAEGALGALVNVGGDLRAAGDRTGGRGWIVAIDDPNDADRVVGTIALEAGAVASSWRTKRAWTAPDGTPRHHLIDPTTGLPAASGLAGVTVVTGIGWRAEVLAKAAFLAGPVEGAALLAANDASGLLVADDGEVHEVGDWVAVQGLRSRTSQLALPLTCSRQSARSTRRLAASRVGYQDRAFLRHTRDVHGVASTVTSRSTG